MHFLKAVKAYNYSTGTLHGPSFSKTKSHWCKFIELCFKKVHFFKTNLNDLVDFWFSDCGVVVWGHASGWGSVHIFPHTAPAEPLSVRRLMSCMISHQYFQKPVFHLMYFLYYSGFVNQEENNSAVDFHSSEMIGEFYSRCLQDKKLLDFFASPTVSV